jgi:hypothetical protein
MRPIKQKVKLNEAIIRMGVLGMRFLLYISNEYSRENVSSLKGDCYAKAEGADPSTPPATGSCRSSVLDCIRREELCPKNVLNLPQRRKDAKRCRVFKWVSLCAFAPLREKSFVDGLLRHQGRREETS